MLAYFLPIRNGASFSKRVFLSAPSSSSPIYGWRAVNPWPLVERKPACQAARDGTLHDHPSKSEKDPSLFVPQAAAGNANLAEARERLFEGKDLRSQIAKLKKAEVQLVVLATVIRETVGALKEAKKLNWEVGMTGVSQGKDNKFVKIADVSYR